MNHLQAVGRTGHVLLATLNVLTRRPWQLNGLLTQIHHYGARSLPVIIIAGIFVGAVVAIQFYDTLVRFGSRSLLGTAVGLSLIRELGPVITALIVIGRAGSAACAEVAVMRAESQLDALECMGIDAYHYLLAPRLLAFLLITPLLTGVFLVTGIAGGAMVAHASFSESVPQFLGSMTQGVTNHDLVLGLLKSVVFGLVIGWLALAQGFLSNGQGGAEGVSRTTTDAVVLASLTIFFLDYVLSALLL